MSDASLLPPSLRALVGVRSERAHALIAYLGALETTLAVSPLLASVGRRLDDASRPLRVPLRVQPYQPVRALDELRAHENFRRGGGDASPGRRLYATRGGWDNPGVDGDMPVDGQILASRDASVQPQLLDTLAASLERAVLLGDPGSGKTEWLKRQAYDAAHTFRQRLEHGTARPEDLPFPVFLPLPTVARALADETRLAAFLAASGCLASPALVLDPARRLAAAVLQALVTQQALPARLLPWVWARLTGPRRPETPPALLLCLDAWDEVRGDRHELATCVRAYATTGIARLFITSRIVGYGDATERPLPPPPADATSGAEPAWRHELQLLPYTGAETATFVDRFFAEAPTRGGGLLRDAMRRELQEKPAVAGMAQNPLLATLLCLAFAADPERAPLPFPLRRGPVYQRVLHGLLGTWRRTKRRTQKEPRLNRELIEAKLRLLEALAVAFFPAEELSAAELDAFLWDEAHGYMRRLDPADALRQRLQRGQATSPLEELCDDGVLVRSGPGDEAGYLFLHLTFQEYLVARARARQAKTHGWAAIAGFVDRAAWLPAVWQEVLVLLAGQLADPRPLLALLADDARDDDLRHRLAVAAECLAELPPARAGADDGVGELASRITSDVFALWWWTHAAWLADPDSNIAEFVVPHLIDALPALAAWNGRVAYPPGVVPTRPQGQQPGRQTHGHPTAPVAWEKGSEGNATPAPTLLALIASLLRNPDSDVRRVATDGLRGCGPAAATAEFLAALAALLRDPDGNLRQTGAGAVHALGPAAATREFRAALAGLLRDRDGEVRRVAAEAVRALGPAAADGAILTALATLLRDPDDRVRQAAMGAVRALKPAAATPEFRAALAGLLRDRDGEVRRVAAEAVRALGPGAADGAILTALATLLRDPDDRVRQEATGAVRALGPAAATAEFCAALATLLGDPDNRVRGAAAGAIRGLGSAADSGILSALTALLRDPDDHVRWVATGTVGEFGPAAADGGIVRSLTALLRDQDNEVRRAAVNVMRMLGPVARSGILTALGGLVRDPESKVRQAAARAVGVLGPGGADSSINEALVMLLRDPNSEVRRAAVDAVGTLGPAAAADSAILTALAALLRDADGGVRWAAVDAVSALGPGAAAPAFLDTLAALLRTPENRARVGGTVCMLGTPRPETGATPSRTPRPEAVTAVVHALGPAAATPGFLAAVEALLRNPDSRVRRSAASVVGVLGSAAADGSILTSLTALLCDPDEQVRWAAVCALEALGLAATDSGTLTALIALLFDPDDKVRRAAVSVMRVLGPAAATAILAETLAARLCDRNVKVRLWATEAVGHLGPVVADSRILATLAALLRDANGEVRKGVVQAVGALGPAAGTTGFLEALAVVLRDPDVSVRLWAVRAVGALGPVAANGGILDALAALLHGRDDSVRREVVGVLAVLGAVTDAGILIALLRDPDAEIRRGAAQAMESALRPGMDREILNAFAALLRDPHDRVRREVADVLVSLRPMGLGLRVFSRGDRTPRVGFASDLGRDSDLPEVHHN